MYAGGEINLQRLLEEHNLGAAIKYQGRDSIIVEAQDNEGTLLLGDPGAAAQVGCNGVMRSDTSKEGDVWVEDRSIRLLHMLMLCPCHSAARTLPLVALPRSCMHVWPWWASPTSTHKSASILQ